ncbi:hypothetical protein Gorai_020337 [Gossypium raimondii]|uniref:Uncharacterized protein n=1 Tax=Gossypium raimondii TaxID=29730 RepID=A0A7J8NM19_GOSRA|nr:hypothetical protein [Gossypium raimondii]
MAFSARNDPFSMQLHAFPGDQRRCFQSIGKLDALGNYNAGVGAGGNCKEPAAGLNLSIKSCFEDSRRTWDKKARAFAPRLARDLEIISYNEPQKVAEPTTDTRGAYRRGNPLDFSDYPLRNKITVAVDVDEVLGNFVSALNKFIADRYSLKRSVSEYHVYEFFKVI